MTAFTFTLKREINVTILDSSDQQAINATIVCSFEGIAVVKSWPRRDPAVTFIHGGLWQVQERTIITLYAIFITASMRYMVICENSTNF